MTEAYGPAHRQSAAIEELATWWRKMAEAEIDRTIPKAIEYGSDDLIVIGEHLARATGRDLTAVEAAELGIYFYIVGKLGRWTAAIREGRLVSDDTIFDLAVYTRMVQRIRETGAWPGV